MPFRRFRVTHKEEWRSRGPDSFLGRQAGKSMTDDYGKLKDDLVFRKEAAIRVGPGFELSVQKDRSSTEWTET